MTTQTETQTPAARIRFERGAVDVTIRSDPTLTERYRASFPSSGPTVTDEGDVVVVEYPRLRGPLPRRRRGGELRLSPSLAWTIEIHDGASGLTVDLPDAELRALEIYGGVSNATIRRADGVPVRLHVRGGARKLTLDEQHLGAVGGPMRLDSPGASEASERLDIDVHGGASNLTVTTGSKD
jgi:hypothetical protein